MIQFLDTIENSYDLNINSIELLSISDSEFSSYNNTFKGMITFDSISNLDNNIVNITAPINYKRKFNTKKYSKRGRKQKNKERSILGKKHNRADFDNIQTKIQVHYINFLVRLANDAIKTEFKAEESRFDKINYSDKKKIRHDYLKGLKSDKIRDIIALNISSKYKKDWNHNKNLCERLNNESEWFRNFMDFKYIDMFHIYYNEEKPLKYYEFKNKRIDFSEKTESYYYLLTKNSDLKNKIINTAKAVYLNRENEKNPLKTIKLDN